MFEISQLKAKKLPELQDIAKQLKVPKYRSLKKLDLVYQILDYQAANPQSVKAEVEADNKTQPKQKSPRQQAPRAQKKPQDNKDNKPSNSKNEGDSSKKTRYTKQAKQWCSG
jgi:transcription termination factor Rho